jgi:hypothetical protein
MPSGFKSLGCNSEVTRKGSGVLARHVAVEAHDEFVVTEPEEPKPQIVGVEGTATGVVFVRDHNRAEGAEILAVMGRAMGRAMFLPAMYGADAGGWKEVDHHRWLFMKC